MKLMVLRYIHLWFSIFKYSIARDMEYKTNFIGSLFVDTIYYITWYYFFEVIYSKTSILGDFDRDAILVFLIATFFVDTLFMMLFDGAGYLREHIRTGSLDFILLRPVNSQFLISFRYIRSYTVVSLLVLSIILYNVLLAFHPDSINVLNILLFIFSLFMGVLIWYSFEFIIASLTFYFRDFRTGGWLSHEVMKFSMRPDSIYRGFMRKILFTILPMALVASFPSRLLLYGLNTQNQQYLIIQIIVVTVLLSLTRIFWKTGLKKYESAQSYTGPVL
jgi:ABC-2 type transport system permease protein